MTTPIVLSDDEDEDLYATPPQPSEKKRKTESGFNFNPSSVFVIDDDPTPPKERLSATSSFVPDTPLSDLRNYDVSIVKCSFAAESRQARAASSDGQKVSGITSFICLSDNESEGGFNKIMNEAPAGFESDGLSEWEPSPLLFKAPIVSVMSSDKESEGGELTKKAATGFESDGLSEWEPSPLLFKAAIYKKPIVDDDAQQAAPLQENRNELFNILEFEAQDGSEDVPMGENVDPNLTATANANRKRGSDDGKKKQTKEDKRKLVEERKFKKEQEKLQKAAMKAEEAERKKMEKEKKKWEKGKLALKSIVAEIDKKVVEQGSIGGHLLSRFSEKGLTFRITTNPIERSIVWSMIVPEEISEPASSQKIEIQYVSVVFEADEFCSLVSKDSVVEHVSRVQSLYPTHTVCYITNRLMSYIHMRDQEQYKNPDKSSWRRPPVEEVLARLTTHCCRVHSRLCVDEAELAEHVVGLTSSLASCQFRSKLTRLTVNANGSMIPKDFVDKNLIKQNLWLKALVAIPKVQPRFAVTIWKKYPTMRSLLSVYMDPSKSLHEKEFLLKDLTVDGLLGDQRRLGEICSKRVYRILMAQSGCIKTDHVELGADSSLANFLS